MLKRRSTFLIVMMVSLALPSIVFAAQAKPAGAKKAPAAAKAATGTKPAGGAAAKATMEQDLKKLKNAPSSAVVAVVGGQAITKGELMNVMWDWTSPVTLDEYINSVLVTQALKKEGLKVTQADIDKKISEVPIQPGETLETMLQRIKVPMARFKAGMTIQAGLEKIIAKQTKLTDADYAEFVHARHILIRTMVNTPNATPEDKTKAEQAAKEKIDKIAAEIKSGSKTFDQAARESSEDPGSKDKGGDLGWFRKGEMFQEVSTAAFSTQPGQMSEPVKTFVGYHIVKVEKLGKDATPAEKEELSQKVLKTKMQTAMRQVFEDLKKNAKIQNNLCPTLPEPERPNFMMGAPPANTPKPAPRPVTPPAPAAPKQ